MRSLSLSACFPAFSIILWGFICYLNFFPPPSVCCPFLHSSYFSCSFLILNSLLLFFLYLYYFLSSLPFLDYFHFFALYSVFITNFSPALLVLFSSPVFNIRQESHIFCTGWQCVCLIPSTELLTTSSFRIDVGGRSAVCCTYRHNEILWGGGENSKLLN